jgi:hypothetical protein
VQVYYPVTQALIIYLLSNSLLQVIPAREILEVNPVDTYYEKGSYFSNAGGNSYHELPDIKHSTRRLT